MACINRRSGWAACLSAVVAFGLAVGASFPTHARSHDANIASISLAALPVEARETDRLIRAGGPFPHAKDGVVFGNRERILPSARRGFYREYTVPTPAARNRGARRIVCGGQVPTAPEACYFTGDHYATFSRITP